MTASTTFDLLDRARGTLMAAYHSDTTTDRYVNAHLSALRSAAALVTDRTPDPRRSRHSRPVRDTWSALAVLAPELTEWADYLALCGARRGAVERGEIPTAREADDLLRDAETFHGLVLAALGLPFEVRTHEPAGLAVAGVR